MLTLRYSYFSPEKCVQATYRVGNWSVGSTLLFHREALEAAGRFDPAYMGLADLVATLIVAARKGIVYSPVPFGASRIHPGSNLSRTLTRENLDRIVARLREGGFPADTGLRDRMVDFQESLRVSAHEKGKAVRGQAGHTIGF